MADVSAVSRVVSFSNLYKTGEKKFTQTVSLEEENEKNKTKLVSLSDKSGAFFEVHDLGENNYEIEIQFERIKGLSDDQLKVLGITDRSSAEEKGKIKLPITSLNVIDSTSNGTDKGFQIVLKGGIEIRSNARGVEIKKAGETAPLLRTKPTLEDDTFSISITENCVRQSLDSSNEKVSFTAIRKDGHAISIGEDLLSFSPNFIFALEQLTSSNAVLKEDTQSTVSLGNIEIMRANVAGFGGDSSVPTKTSNEITLIKQNNRTFIYHNGAFIEIDYVHAYNYPTKKGDTALNAQIVVAPKSKSRESFRIPIAVELDPASKPGLSTPKTKSNSYKVLNKIMSFLGNSKIEEPTAGSNTINLGRLKSEQASFFSNRVKIVNPRLQNKSVRFNEYVDEASASTEAARTSGGPTSGSPTPTTPKTPESPTPTEETGTSGDPTSETTAKETSGTPTPTEAARTSGDPTSGSPTPATPETPESPTPATPETPESPTPAMPKTPESPTPATPETPESPTPATPKTPESPTPATPKTPESPTPATPKTPESPAPAEKASETSAAPEEAPENKPKPEKRTRYWPKILSSFGSLLMVVGLAVAVAFSLSPFGLAIGGAILGVGAISSITGKAVSLEYTKDSRRVLRKAEKLTKRELKKFRRIEKRLSSAKTRFFIRDTKIRKLERRLNENSEKIKNILAKPEESRSRAEKRALKKHKKVEEKVLTLKGKQRKFIAYSSPRIIDALKKGYVARRVLESKRSERTKENAEKFAFEFVDEHRFDIVHCLNRNKGKRSAKKAIQNMSIAERCLIEEADYDFNKALSVANAEFHPAVSKGKSHIPLDYRTQEILGPALTEYFTSGEFAKRQRKKGASKRAVIIGRRKRLDVSIIETPRITETSSATETPVEDLRGWVGTFSDKLTSLELQQNAIDGLLDDDKKLLEKADDLLSSSGRNYLSKDKRAQIESSLKTYAEHENAKVELKKEQKDLAKESNTAKKDQNRRTADMLIGR